MSRSPPQRRKARARNGVALHSDGSFIAGTVKSGASVYGCSKRGVDVATAWDGNPAPKGPGRDSTAGPVRSMTAPVPVREVARSHGQ
ncbi:hypothetical protein KJM07_004168 [Salmonella enterica]|uniref:Uncharacterized protein n=1 Tax=Salmonella newport TaxID=108619 RepID=A0A636IKN8_SALNE|nr:hypothetical protein [Salmonella enterica]ECB4487337.1 hypothetical protein [Salmonella enterica subsp. enterica serovar Java]EDI0448416.1 hypothetical protein [Salmonella enterica subsp. enterica serovar Newport]EDR9814305.1 hypothetical protein [Salmonella enterica subsp. enterica serovar Teko]EDV9143063.1 hypothetical protein [Salmonella enterica subsp. enterica serovar Gombe]EDV9732059.1 hypothetical protein [Salmonella enterica subsp. enterica]EGH6922551.1 hypothetical protein [Salmon